MQIIIPLSGVGQRFLNAGYKDIKPLIKVDGKPMIEHVVNLFPKEKNITFICNKEHLKTTNLKETLQRIAPTAKIIAIEPHKKGPVYTVSKIFDIINPNEEAIVNYCDFSKYWDYDDFLKQIHERNVDGAISAYTGFHPHMLGTTNYAFMREKDRYLLEIREKQPFTNNRMNEYASDGTYYFKKGEYIIKYFAELMEKDINIKREYYVSLVYNLMLKDKLKVWIYEIEHMLQWGTPQDLEEYQKWSDYFRYLTLEKQKDNTIFSDINLIPLAGKGSRFKKEGYNIPKPLINVFDKPMVVNAASDLPKAKKNIFVMLEEHTKNFHIDKEIKNYFPNSKIVIIPTVTEGQAITCELGLKNENPNNSLLISASDNGVVWNKEKYHRLIFNEKADVIVWTFLNHASANRKPEMYGWVKTDKQNNVQFVSVKKPISETPKNDHGVVGTFYFKKIEYFLEGLKRLKEKNNRINNEFYVDTLINELLNMDIKIKVFPVDFYVCWGTPDELRTFQYWQTFFDKCSWHPYKNESNK